MIDLSKILNYHELQERIREEHRRDLRLLDQSDPLKLSKEKYDYLMQLAKDMPEQHGHIVDQIDHETMRFKP